MLEPAERLYVAPHLDDLYLSCPGRLFADQARGERTALVGLFDPPADEVAEERDRQIDAMSGEVGLVRVRAGLPRLADRRAAADAPSGPADEELLRRVTDLLHDIGYRTRARDVVVPLGVGGHPEAQACHVAALRAYRSGDGRNVFLYEDRPDAVVPGAVRMRLAQVGAWLPPGAAHSADDGGLASFLLSFNVPPSLRGELRSWAERLRSTGDATRQWREARAWHPMRGLGPRLQPVTHVPAESAQETVGTLAAAVVPGTVRSRVRSRFDALSRDYARRLGGTVHAERYWLLLPTRQEGAGVPEEEHARPA